MQRQLLGHPQAPSRLSVTIHTRSYFRTPPSRLSRRRSRKVLARNDLPALLLNPGYPTITTPPRNALHAIVLERCVITPNTAHHSIQRPMTPSVRVVGLVAGWSTRHHFPEDPLRPGSRRHKADTATLDLYAIPEFGPPRTLRLARDFRLCARSTCVPRGWADAYNDVHCSGSPITVDRTPRAAFNRPI